jgi:hypothetical protein
MAHLGTYTSGGITYDRHSGRAIAGENIDAEFAEEFEKEYAITSKYYNTVNLENYKKLADFDYDGAADKRAQLFMNANGEQILTFGQGNGILFPGLPSGPTEESINRNSNEIPFYDFSKPNQENGASFTQTGVDFYAGRDDYLRAIENGLDQTEIPYEEWKTERLIEIEKELVSATTDQYDKMKKTNSSQVKPQNIMTKEELEEAGIETNGEFQGASNQELQERISRNYKGLHSSDRFLQRLSLKNLKYPIDADYGNTQDYIQINQFTYQATSPKILFGGSDSITEFGSILESGLKMGTPKEKVVGLVKLPMPNDLTDSNNVAWGEDQLNAITAAAATLASGGVSGGLKILEDIAKGDQNLLQGLSQALTGTREGLGKAVGQARTAFENNPDAELLGRSVLGSGLLNLAGFGLSPEAILARGAGIIPNSNLQLLFNAPTLRAFRFNWKMSPRSQEEAIRINNIIRFFKQGMAVKKRKNSGPGGASYFLATPNVFDISFRTSKTNQEINNRNNSVLRMKTCACVGAAVNYTPQGMWNAYEKGQPTSSILSLQFKELEPVYNTDYEEDPFEYDNLTGFVPENGVGY